MIRQRIEVEEAVVEEIAGLGLNDVDIESQVRGSGIISKGVVLTIKILAVNTCKNTGEVHDFRILLVLCIVVRLSKVLSHENRGGLYNEGVCRGG